MANLRLKSAIALGFGVFCASPAAAASVELRRCIGSKFPPAVRESSCNGVIAGAGGDKVLLERAHNARGLVRIALARYADAVEDFNEVIRLNSKIAGYYDNRQSAYHSMGELDYALSDAYAAVRLAPTYAFVFRARGLVFADMAQYPLAINDFTAAINLNSEDADVYVERGKALMHQGQTAQALGDFTTAISRDSTLADAYKQRGLAYQKRAMPAAAITDLEQALSLQPGNIETAQALQALR